MPISVKWPILNTPVKEIVKPVMEKEEPMSKNVEPVKEEESLPKWFNSDLVCTLNPKPIVTNVEVKEKFLTLKTDVNPAKEIKFPIKPKKLKSLYNLVFMILMKLFTLVKEMKCLEF